MENQDFISGRYIKHKEGRDIAWKILDARRIKGGLNLVIEPWNIAGERAAALGSKYMSAFDLKKEKFKNWGYRDYVYGNLSQEATSTGKMEWDGIKKG